ncbi:MAG TPA: phosphate ABC transporter permease subunit PstC [Oscillospiraceae bacterium]|nr:phosphate ABC transporter permease subunit PstC [Oscillospiraceae bacterium]
MYGHKDKLIASFLTLIGVFIILLVIGIFGLLISNSFAAWQEIGLRDFLGSTVWNPSGYQSNSYGILGMIASTLLVTAGAMLTAVSVGIACALYLAEIAAPWEREIIKPIVEILAAIPSVVLGFFGIVVLAPLLARLLHLNNGLNALNGSLLLALMSLPTIISIAEDALNSVPQEYKEASLALGATRMQTLLKVSLPTAASGVTAAVLLGIGRAIGETMTVIMATGNALAFPSGFLSSVRTMTATIAAELGEVPYNSLHYQALFAIGFLLFALSFVISLVADYFLQRAAERSK